MAGVIGSLIMESNQAHRKGEEGEKKEGGAREAPPQEDSGGVLLSHNLAVAVSSALEGLTAVFGMGTGGSPPAWPPENRHNVKG